MKANLVVVFGGNSVEHEISIITAIQAMENLNKEKYNVLPVFLSKSGHFYYDTTFFNIDTFKDMSNITKKMEVSFSKSESKVELNYKNKSLFSSSLIANVDMVFPIVHGTNVEDGKLQGYFETLSLPIIGTTTTSGVVGQDKAIMKDILKAHNISQTNYLWVLESDDLDSSVNNIIASIGESVIIKPAELGSSIGIKVAHGFSEIKLAIEEGFNFSSKIVVEQLLTNFQEVNISVVGNYKDMIVSSTEEVSKNDEILSYEDKYLSGSKSKNKTQSSGMASLGRIIPANLDSSTISEIENIAKLTYRVLNSNGVIRIDLMIVDNKIYVNEVNNIPGSLAYYLWEASDLSYCSLLDLIIEKSVDVYYDKISKTYTIDTNVLSNVGSKL